MKKTNSTFPKFAGLVVLFACGGIGCALARPESEIYSPAQIHHYASNKGASTVTVEVPSHYSYKTGHYVMVPKYSAEAPLPRDRYSAAYWIPYSSTEAGHWAVKK